LRVPFRDYRANFGDTEQISVQYLTEIDREYCEVKEAEKEEQQRRIREFETIDVELPFSIANLIRESPICILFFFLFLFFFLLLFIIY
jgi:hypothetical protein